MTHSLPDNSQTLSHLQKVTDLSVENKSVMNVYKEWATTYDELETALSYTQPFIGARHLARMLDGRQGARILDVAAGTGLVAVSLRKAGFMNLDAVDGSQQMLDVAQSKGIYNNYICAMIGSGKIDGVDDDAYDGLVCVGSFLQGHLSYTCFPALLRAVTKGGFIVIAVNERRLIDFEDFRNNLEPAMHQLQEEKKWTWTERVVESKFQGEDSGIIYIFQKL